MKTFYFKFVIGQKHAGYCQPIKARDAQTARQKMVELHGNKWAFQYSEEEWNKIKQAGYAKERLLPFIVVNEKSPHGNAD